MQYTINIYTHIHNYIFIYTFPLTEVNRSMNDVVSKVSNLLDLHPPPNGGIDFTTENTDRSHLSLGYVFLMVTFDDL